MTKVREHEKTIDNFLAARPTWAKHGFRGALNKHLESEEIEPVAANLGFIPDAYEIDTANATVRLLEVDGSSYTKKEKLRRIAAFAWELDARMWFTELHTIQLFTGARSVLTDDDLCGHMLEFMYQDAQKEH